MALAQLHDANLGIGTSPGRQSLVNILPSLESLNHIVSRQRPI